MGSSIRSNLFLRELCLFSPFLRRSGCASPAVLPSTTAHIAIGGIRCAAAQSSDGGSQGKTSARLSLMKQVLRDAEERALSAGSEPTPKISLEHVTISYARSGGPGGQNVNKVNTKVDMRFNVKKAYWLSERVRDRILQMEKNRINKDGELVISSTKTRTQKGNIDDALEKLQGIIDAASYVPPPPSEEQKKRIEKLAWTSVCKYAIKEDKEPLVWGKQSTIQIKESIKAQESHKKLPERNQWLVQRMKAFDRWEQVYQEPEMVKMLFSSYDSMRAVFEDLQRIKEAEQSLEQRAAIGEQKRLLSKKALSQKKAIRRNRSSWD